MSKIRYHFVTFLVIVGSLLLAPLYFLWFCGKITGDLIRDLWKGKR